MFYKKWLLNMLILFISAGHLMPTKLKKFKKIKFHEDLNWGPLGLQSSSISTELTCPGYLKNFLLPKWNCASCYLQMSLVLFSWLWVKWKLTWQLEQNQLCWFWFWIVQGSHMTHISPNTTRLFYESLNWNINSYRSKFNTSDIFYFSPLCRFCLNRVQFQLKRCAFAI